MRECARGKGIRKTMAKASTYKTAAFSLLARALRRGETVQLAIDGQSMAPFLRSGDGVFVAAVAPEEIRRGDLIVVEREADWVTHRVVAIREGDWITKGDHLPHLDPPVPAEAILGRVVAVERNGIRRACSGLRWTISSRMMAWLSWAEGGIVGIGRAVKSRIVRFMRAASRPA